MSPLFHWEAAHLGHSGAGRALQEAIQDQRLAWVGMFCPKFGKGAAAGVIGSFLPIWVIPARSIVALPVLQIAVIVSVVTGWSRLR